MNDEGSVGMGTGDIRPFRETVFPRVYSTSLWMLLNFLLLLVFGLATGRLLYEWRFPFWLWLALPLPAAALAMVVAAVTSYFLRRNLDRRLLFIILTPLLLNLVYLLDPTVNLVRGRFLFFAALWLSAALFATWRFVGRAQSPNVFVAHSRSRLVQTFGRWYGAIFALLALLPIYLFTMSQAVGQADTFEFQVVAPQLGIAHPTGYPLYLLLGKLFSLLPLGSVAWRLNLASAVFALITTILIYRLACRMLHDVVAGRYLAASQMVWLGLPALLAAVALGLSPTFWSQAIVAEVYTLHALLVALALSLMVSLLRPGVEAARQERLGIMLALVCGLALTNHVTSVFLLPGAAVAVVVAFGRRLPISVENRSRKDAKENLANFASLRETLIRIVRLGLAFAAPLLLYAYLPLRWQAVNHEPMGVARFVDWVVGGRFQGALQWNAWLQDLTRFEVIGRLFLQNWGWPYLILALIGFIILVRRQRLVALVLFLTWFGFTFYALNYYVPDLAVFLIPSHLVIALCLAAGIAAPFQLGDWEIGISNLAISQSPFFHILWLIACALPAIWLAANHWTAISQAGDDGLLPWGAGVLALPLENGAALLADSEKIAPLYYLQQAEGVRPDLEIMVLPDEAAYRAELDRRVAAGQTVYLARFLPGLAGGYSLRSAGPLVEASNRPLESVPPEAATANLRIGPLELLGYMLEPAATVDAGATAVTLYWRKAEDAGDGGSPVLYIRWAGSHFTGKPLAPAGQHPVNNQYPINAWKGSEIVPDYYLLPHPLANCTASCQLSIEVAAGPPYSPADALDWQPVTTLTVPAAGGFVGGHRYRAQLSSFLLETAAFPAQLRPGSRLEVQYQGYGDGEALGFELRPVDEHRGVEERGSRGELAIVSCQLLMGNCQLEGVYMKTVQTPLENGRYDLVATGSNGAAVCGWLRPVTAGCVLGEVEISGIPLPSGATNFDDQIALLDISLQQETLQPGGRLALEVTWQSLAPMGENYTVFVQVLNEQDQIVGQVDAWPVQGTHPTSQWRVGEIFRDPYVVQLQGDLAPGPYQLYIGWYLLSTLQRLPVVDDQGIAVDDKVIVGGLRVP